MAPDSIAAFHERIAGGASIVDEVEQHFARIDQVNPTLNAIVAQDRDRALSEAEAADRALRQGQPLGPLTGVPFTLKDVWASAGLVTTSGTLGCAGRVPDEDCTVLARLRGAGAILLGKSNTSELSLAFESENLVYGRTLNPYKHSHSPGGSSGGGAAAVAAGLCYFDVGTDAGGSIRVPAHFCGVAGLKATTGRIPLTGCVPPAIGPGGRLVAAGPIARNVDDLRRVLSVLQGPDGHDVYCAPVPAFTAKERGLRAICFPGNPDYEQHPEVTRLVNEAVGLLGECGIEVVTSKEDDVIDDAFQTLMQIVTADGADWIRELLKELGTTQAHEWTQGTLDALEGEGVSAKEFLDAASDWDEIQRFMLEYTSDFDLVVGPVVSTPTLEHGELVDVETIPAYAPAMLHNITGWPAVSVPVGLTADGLPVGFQIAAKAWREADCLHAAELLEAKLGKFSPPEFSAGGADE